MKELSIEQKAKAYDEAIKRAKVFKEHLLEINDKGYADEMDYIFPELKESEDERIRKGLIEACQKSIIVGGFHKDKVIAWLEKQGEHKKFINGIQVGDKVTRNEDGVLVNLSQLNRVAKKDEKQGEQKPILDVEIPFGAKDSELQEATYYIPKGFHAEIEGNNVIIKKGEQNTAWSEEDERMMMFCCDYLDDNQKSWLLSLKERYTWKPSDEQMELLREVQQALLGKDCHNRFVNFMYELKRLREE